jgi:hypothetical protein
LAREARHASIAREHTGRDVILYIAVVFSIGAIASKKLDGKLVSIESHQFVGGLVDRQSDAAGIIVLLCPILSSDPFG